MICTNAGIHTGTPPMRVHTETNEMSYCTPDERDRPNHTLPAGYFNDWFRTDSVNLSVDLRNQINGNSFIRGFTPKLNNEVLPLS